MTGPRPPLGQRGITLLELVVVMAIFALVAVMGLQALSGSMRARDRLTEVDETAAELGRALTLLRRDLKSAVPWGFFPVDSEEPERAFVDRLKREGRLAFTTAGQPVLPDVNAAGLSRVIWRYDARAGQLIRQVWPVLHPAGAQALSPPVVMLEDVTGMSVLAYAGKKDGWINDYGADPDVPRDPLPGAIDLRLTSARFGPLRIMVTF